MILRRNNSFFFPRIVFNPLAAEHVGRHPTFVSETFTLRIGQWTIRTLELI